METSKRAGYWCGGGVMIAVLALTASSFAPADPLPSWNDTAPKKAILSFIAAVTDKNSNRFVPAEERIATFDNDGTLWVEQPIYPQLIFAADRVKALAPQHPDWASQDPFALVLQGDLKGALAGGENSAARLGAVTDSGMTPDEFQVTVKDWIRTARHPRFNRPYTECIYQPMLDLMTLLRTNEFKVYIVSGEGVEFLRAWTSSVYGVPPEQVIGSMSKLKFEMRHGSPDLLKLPDVEFVDDKDGKPIGIQKFIGRRPIAAFGNSDGDQQMLEWTADAPGLRFALLVHHTDADREWAYDRHSLVGKLDKALDEANAKGWTVVSMKDDWKTIFPKRWKNNPGN